MTTDAVVMMIVLPLLLASGAVVSAWHNGLRAIRRESLTTIWAGAGFVVGGLCVFFAAVMLPRVLRSPHANPADVAILIANLAAGILALLATGLATWRSRS